MYRFIMFLAVAAFLGGLVAYVIQEPAPEPTIFTNSGTVYTEAAYRKQIDTYIDKYGYEQVCIQHRVFQLGNIRRNLTTYFPTEREQQNALRVIELYEERCRRVADG